MNITEIVRYQKMIAAASPKVAKSWVDELKTRACGLNTRYRGSISELKYANKIYKPDINLLGNQNGFFLSIDIENAYQFQSEYNGVHQELKALGYAENLKTAESVDPAALSNLMTMAFEKRKALEDRAMQLLGSVNTVVKSIISITYELKELDRNYSFYKLAESSDLQKKAASELALKRIFIDNVDARKGGASLSALSRAPTQGQGGAGFIDLISVFYSVKSLKDTEALQRNEQYKNIIKNRYVEYEEWKKINKADLSNRREMLLQYLKSQAAAYEMYKNWAVESLSILNRINMKGVTNASDYMNAAKRPDIMETSEFSVEVMAAKSMYVREYEVEYQRAFGTKGPELPSKVTPLGKLLTEGPKEGSRSFLHTSLRKHGPKVVAALEASFSFTEKQFFPKGVPQDRAQYMGTLGIKIKPYCFTLDEWYLFKKALETYINKTVFQNLDQVSVSSLNVIKKDLDKYIAEAEKKDEKEKPKSNYALFDIYQAFKDDLVGINKSMSFVAGAGEKRAFDPNIYEIEVSHRMFNRFRTKDAVAVGLFRSNADASLIYEEFKRRKKLLNPLSTFDNQLF